LGHEGFGEAFMVQSSPYGPNLSCTVLEYMMPELVQQDVKTHEVSQPRGLARRLFVKEDLIRKPGQAVADQVGAEGLGLP
jgi:hypothetical protein